MRKNNLHQYKEKTNELNEESTKNKQRPACYRDIQNFQIRMIESYKA